MSLVDETAKCLRALTAAAASPTSAPRWRWLQNSPCWNSRPRLPGPLLCSAPRSRRSHESMPLGRHRCHGDSGGGVKPEGAVGHSGTAPVLRRTSLRIEARSLWADAKESRASRSGKGPRRGPGAPPAAGPRPFAAVRAQWPALFLRGGPEGGLPLSSPGSWEPRVSSHPRQVCSPPRRQGNLAPPR